MRRAWAKDARTVLSELRVKPVAGLTPEEVGDRRLRWGANLLQAARPRRTLQIFLSQFASVIVGLLVGAAALSFAFGEWVDGLAIVAVLIVNALLGFVAELKAVRSMEALRQLTAVDARVRRGGAERTVPAQQLVPGDIVVVEEGTVVTADLRLVEANGLQADESTLTGESLPVVKSVETVAARRPLAERTSMLFKGTSIPRGSGIGVVVGTGMATELGQIARLVEEAEAEATPLEVRLGRLGRRLIGFTLVVAALTIAAGISSGRDVFLMIEMGIALAVAAVPEGLPIVVTIALARGMWHMARRKALINRLSAVETLGAATLILTDKTGTLTENRLTVERFELPVGSSLPTDIEEAASPDLLRALETATLCNNSALSEEGDDPLAGAGDPLELALLAAARRGGVDRNELLARLPEVREEAFDSTSRLMATYHRDDDSLRVAVKGAAESVLEAATAVRESETVSTLEPTERNRWLARNGELAGQGLRVLALAEKSVDHVEEEPYSDLVFLGLVGLHDPPRMDAKPALDACRSAGIRVVMVTGDNPATAEAIAEAVGLVDPSSTPEIAIGAELDPLERMSLDRKAELSTVPIFARVDPAQKLELIALHQAAGEVVAMTGDGVNDAPALKKSDIGVAMGLRGTQVAKEAAAMVLEDDSFASIVAAIEQGRVIFDNIRRFVLYLLSCNLSEILVVGLATALNAPLPILPLQILFLNLVTDVFPALALAFGEGERGVMRRPPRDPEQPILTERQWWTIGAYGLLITVTVIGALGFALRVLRLDVDQAVTVSFLTLAMSQLWHVFNVRELGSSFSDNEVVRNPWVWGALALCTALLVAAVFLPGLNTALGTANPGWRGWALAFGLSLVPWAVGQLSYPLRGRRHRNPPPTR